MEWYVVIGWNTVIHIVSKWPTFSKVSTCTCTSWKRCIFNWSLFFYFFPSIFMWANSKQILEVVAFFFFFNIKFLSDELVAVFLFVCFNNFSVVSNMIFKCTGIHNSYYFRLGTAPFFCCLWKTILCQNHGLCLNEQDTWFELFRNWLQNVVLANWNWNKLFMQLLKRERNTYLGDAAHACIEKWFCQ